LHEAALAVVSGGLITCTSCNIGMVRRDCMQNIKLEIQKHTHINNDYNKAHSLITMYDAR